MSLALKYRPAQFADLIGQNSISQTLSLALDQNKISNAYLFSGLRGSGKTSSARIFARALQCDKGPTSKPCGECDNCKASLNGRHIDIIEMDAASNRRIDDIRDLIEQTKYKPGFGRYKIFIIDEVHMLTKEAFNALLKTLEEPPEFVKFILATTDPLLLPATILSRTQHFRFKKIPHRSVVNHITNILEKENIPYESSALEIIARSGAGSLRDTLTLLDQAIIFGNNSVNPVSVTEMLGLIDPQTLESFFQAILQNNQAKVEEIFNLMSEYECEMVLDEIILFLKDKALHKSTDFAPLFLNRCFYILAQSKTLLSLNTNGEFVLLLTISKLQEALKLKDITSFIHQLERTQPIPNTPIPTQTLELASNTQNTQETQTQSTNAKPPFEVLINKLYDRNLALGECFEKNIVFVEFANHSLQVQSLAKDTDREMLVQNSSIIKALVKEVFGEEANLQILPTQPSMPITPSPSPTPIQENLASQKIYTTPPTQTQESTNTPTTPSTSPFTPPTTPLVNQPNPPSFQEKNKDLLINLKKHLEVDLTSVKKIEQ